MPYKCLKIVSRYIPLANEGNKNSLDVKTDYSEFTNDNLITTDNVAGTVRTETTIEHFTGLLTGHASGSLIDLFVGYNFQPTNNGYMFGVQAEGTVLGGEAEDIPVGISVRSGGTARGTRTVTDITTTGGLVTNQDITRGTRQFTANVNDDLETMASLIVRAGKLVTEKTYVYVLGGGTGAFFDNPDGKNWYTTWTAGLGVEKKINQNWSLLAEGRFLRFTGVRDINDNDFTRNTEVQSIPPRTIVRNDRDVEMSTSRVSLGGLKIAIVYHPT
jgi:opacity protein-like surface antigen